MKLIFIISAMLISVFAQGQVSGSFESDYQEISRIFETESRPYFVKLVSNQFAPGVDKSRDQALLEKTRVSDI